MSSAQLSAVRHITEIAPPRILHVERRQLGVGKKLETIDEDANEGGGGSQAYLKLPPPLKADSNRQRSPSGFAG
ncbi:hypothetical protein MLD38_024244 [Melastoma candidum]|uniref:Uncharacterized protein n=1 Tax=Melastoma candidum TaxID=119954 RepID=A0ACB9NRQ2_9MYRT|nr:hypothetical protein MLD38_024244 [Melastoma candidum]